MSKRVVSGITPFGKPHPATKWSLLMALLVVVVLGIPKMASAGTPTVKPPTGPQSGGVFTSTYTFDTYISCTGGPSYNWMWSQYQVGTTSYVFYGASDGSLLVSVSGGGYQLLQSCGNPYVGDSEVASYTVVAGTPPPPTPTPTPPPPPTPTPTPHATPKPSGSGGSGGTSGGSSGSGQQSSSANTTPTQSTSQSTTSGPVPIVQASSPTPIPLSTPLPPKVQATQSLNSDTTAVPTAHSPSLTLASTSVSLILLLVILFALWRVRRLREWVMMKWRLAMIRLEPYWFKVRRSLQSIGHIHGRDVLRSRGLTHHKHSGKLMAHHHTSYAALLFLLMLSFVLAGAVSLSSRADSVSSSVLSLTVTGPPPSTGATISSPTSGQTFTDPTQTVLGTCPSGLFVEIWINGSFAGDSDCDVNDLYGVLVTLTPGENDLIARDIDGLGQYGPDSPTVVVYYNPPPPPPPPTPSPTPSPTSTPTKTPTAQPSKSTSKTKPQVLPPVATSLPPKITSSQHYYQGAGVGQAVPWSVVVSGGTAPYAVTWEWGDGSTSTMFARVAGTIKDQHNYQKPGIYQLTIRVQDASRRQAVLQLVVVVNGQVTPASLGQSSGDPGNLVTVWPLLTVTTLVVLSLWLGEHHKLAMLRPVPV